ncbi:MAG: ATP-dependent Clp protease proteolytic subunit [Bryobacteraceae bacterium]|nr:ATP-dependent Clp protease proteolytic subunit [Bryobacteraceae bacterium]
MIAPQVPNNSSIFRPNPKRSVFVDGQIDEKLVRRLTPRILDLQAESREPITVYIDSDGGSVFYADRLVDLLRAPGQDGEAPCRLIAVSTTLAASAAADLLSSADYAIAYPEAGILHHGTRQNSASPLTVQNASALAASLKSTNDQFASRMAKRCSDRLVLRFATLRGPISTGLSTYEKGLTDLPNKLSPNGNEVLGLAKRQIEAYDTLLLEIRASNFTGCERIAEYEREILIELVRYEVNQNPETGWSFEKLGMNKLSQDFLLLSQYLGLQHDEELLKMCHRWAPFFLSKSDLAKIAEKPEKERDDFRLDLVQGHARPIWLLLIAICKTLQDGEHWLTARDAYWLGLIDEVYGATDLLTLRTFYEVVLQVLTEAETAPP